MSTDVVDFASVLSAGPAGSVGVRLIDQNFYTAFRALEKMAKIIGSICYLLLHSFYHFHIYCIMGSNWTTPM